VNRNRSVWSIRDIIARMRRDSRDDRARTAEMIAAALAACASIGAIVFGTIWLLNVLGYLDVLSYLE
jgi:hypothetical protein